MFFFAGLIVLAGGAIPLFRVIRRSKRSGRTAPVRELVSPVLILSAVVLFLILFNVFFHYYTELLWFQELGYDDRFWTVLVTQVLLFAGTFVLAFTVLFFNLKHTSSRLQSWNSPSYRTILLAGSSAVLAVIFALSVAAMWEELLLFLNRAPSTVQDPVFGRSMSFYLFSLQFYNHVVGRLQFLIALTLAGVGSIAFFRLVGSAGSGDQSGLLRRAGMFLSQVFLLSALLLGSLAAVFYLNLFELLYSPTGVVTGAGYVDIRFRTTGYFISMGVFLLGGILLLLCAVSSRLRRKLLGIYSDPRSGELGASKKIAVIPGAAVAILLLANWAVPIAVQALVVEPNEITLERLYIANNIRFTRAGYGLTEDRVTEKMYTPGREVTAQLIARNRSTVNNIRLWDWRALMDNLSERQEIRQYYKFFDVDIDRYLIDGEYRVVMLAAREMEKDLLAEEAQTWVSQRLKYTHGLGLVLLPANEFLANGQPNMLIRDIPPASSTPSFSVSRPSIYFGERTRDHVYVKTTEEEFHYPEGEQNVFTTYEGSGGVNLGGFLRRLAYTWKFNEYQLLFSRYFTSESRVLFHREIRERVAKLAPFLMFDGDPYLVLTDDGRLKYIIDTYVTSTAFPYSEVYRGRLEKYHGLNYFRNSVKAVIDAYDGTVDFYISDEDDLFIQTYRNVFPDLFRPIAEMPDDLRAHVRYPMDYLTLQAEMYSLYHMDDPVAFYQREDLWQFGTEKYRDEFIDVTPYYILMEFPEGELEFALILPFTPRDRNVIRSWMAGRSDFPNYGKLVVYTFPKGESVLGPRQVEARIDQNSQMSQTLTLWGQRGSEIIRGNLLVLPLFEGDELHLLYAEPLFLQAENARLPELRRIILADQTRVVWDQNFENALSLLVGERPAAEEALGTAPVGAADDSLLRQATAAFREYRRLLSEGQFASAGRQLELLSEIFENIPASDGNPEGPDGDPAAQDAAAGVRE